MFVKGLHFSSKNARLLKQDVNSLTENKHLKEKCHCTCGGWWLKFSNNIGKLHKKANIFSGVILTCMKTHTGFASLNSAILQCTNDNIFFCLVEFNPVKLETSLKSDTSLYDNTRSRTGKYHCSNRCRFC